MNTHTKVHKIKLKYQYCDDIIYGRKTFEIRLNDRAYQTGDIIKFISIDSLDNHCEHNIEEHFYEITYVISHQGLKDNWIVFGIKEITDETTTIKLYSALKERENISESITLNNI